MDNKHTCLSDVVADLLDLLEPEPYRDGLKETPDRVASYFQEVTSGYGVDPQAVLKLFEDGAENVDEMVFQGAIPFFSLCEHHMVPFFGVAHIGYIPNKKIVGLSKFSRLIEIFARRLQVQERLTNQIADSLMDNLDPLGVGVVIRARHLCMESRGVQKTGTITYTSALRGAIKTTASVRAEFLKFVELADARTSVL